MANVEKLVYTVLEVLIATGCCLGNLLVMCAVWSSRKRWQPTFCLIFSLSMADFLVGCVTIPVAVLVDGRIRTSFKSCLFSCCLILMLPLASILSLLAIAVDRYLRVLTPLRYKKTVTERRSWAVVAACWFLAGTLSFTPNFGWYKHETLSANASMLCTFTAVIPKPSLMYFHSLLCGLIPLMVMTALYSCIFSTIRTHLKGGVGGSAQTQSQAYLRKERTLAGSLALVLALFAVCWLPLHIMNAVSYFGGPSHVPIVVVHAGIVLSHANSAVNPIVYAFKVQKIRKALLQFWRCVVSGYEQGSQNTENVSSNQNIHTHRRTDRLAG